MDMMFLTDSCQICTEAPKKAEVMSNEAEIISSADILVLFFMLMKKETDLS
ncbi:hypothetical protein SDC9_116368 [bioreactor metagenome]|uniref:Uncharacterized protein n=1 Tax=bioreactor metagenome TaxID=1076179 RepID=A0A645C250_9ZZZZ